MSCSVFLTQLTSVVARIWTQRREKRIDNKYVELLHRVFDPELISPPTGQNWTGMSDIYMNSTFHHIHYLHYSPLNDIYFFIIHKFPPICIALLKYPISISQRAVRLRHWLDWHWSTLNDIIQKCCFYDIMLYIFWSNFFCWIFAQFAVE